MTWRWLAALVLLASTAQAENTLYLRSGPGDFIGGGEHWVVRGDPQTTFTAERLASNTIAVNLNGPGGSFWWLRFSGTTTFPEAGQVYGGFGGYGGPSVTGDGRTCQLTSGSFAVHELVVDENGAVQSFAADFEHRCGNETATLYGAVRFRAGDGACTADGVPCDDHDPCTHDDACAGGVCRGVAPACSDGDACTDTDLCEPMTGACVGGTRLDCSDAVACNGEETCDAATGLCVAGTPVSCDDGDACNGVETCDARRGGCVASEPLLCADTNPCTEERCEPAVGCVVDRGACWAVSGRTRATACLDGRCAKRTAPFSGLLVLFPDGHYRIPTTGGCQPGGTEFSDEIGTWRTEADGRTLLLPSNLDDLVDEQNACPGSVALTIRKYASWVRIAPDGTSLTGLTRWRGAGHARRRRVPLVLNQRFRARRVE